MDYVATVTIAYSEYLTAAAVSVASLCRWITSLPLPLSLLDYWIISLPLPPSFYALLTEEDAYPNEVGHWREVGRSTFIGAAPPHFLEWVV